MDHANYVTKWVFEKAPESIHGENVIKLNWCCYSVILYRFETTSSTSAFTRARLHEKESLRINVEPWSNY